MGGARGDALDWALALSRAPAERLVLRQRPLPEGIDALLQIASGHNGEALSSAVSRSGETEKDLVETVRFYLREVLFHSSADAYRILGLERGASAAQIKAHHRWLQQWLHPDRHTSDWDAIFAGRVNAAWNQLRNEDRRRAYDAEHLAEPVWRAVPLPLPTITGWPTPVPPRSTRDRWQRRAPLLALMVACVGLGVMALRDLAHDEALIAAAQDGASEGDAAGQGDPTVDSLRSFHIPERAAVRTAEPRPAQSSSVRRSLPVRQAVARRTQDTGRLSSIRVRTPMAGQPPAQALRTSVPSVVAPSKSPARSAAAKAVATSSGALLRRSTAPPQAVAIPVTVPPRHPGVASAKPVPSLAKAKAVAPVTQPSPAPLVATIAAAPAKSPASAKPSALQPDTPTSAVLAAERVRQAQQVGDRLLVFMRRPGSKVPPIWDTLSAQQGAAQMRQELLAEGSANFSQPDWRIGERDARMQVAVRHVDGRSGRLNAGLVWREQRWLVSRLSMERDW